MSIANPEHFAPSLGSKLSGWIISMQRGRLRRSLQALSDTDLMRIGMARKDIDKLVDEIIS